MGHQKIALFLTVAMLLLCSCSLAKLTTKPVSTASGVEFVMSTWLEQSWNGEHSQEAYDEILSRLKALEGKLSLYDAGSEIAKLNQNAGKTGIVMSEEVYKLLKQAKLYGEQSKGLFDITVAPLTLLWDVTAENPKVPEAANIESAKGLIDYKNLELTDETRTAYLTGEGMSVDLGAIAKGYAAEKMREVAREYKVQGYLSLGGNMMVEGMKSDGRDFRIGVRDPLGDASAYMGVITNLDGLTMATTGGYERFFVENGVTYHHVMNPFTGYPCETDLLSVTVIAKDGALADYLSTLVFMGGSAGLQDFLSREDCMILAITRRQEVFASPKLWSRFEYSKTQKDYTFIKENK